MTFKEIVESDVHVTFLNPLEFSEIHTVNGKEMPVQMDAIEQIEREKRMGQHIDGVYVNENLIYVSATDFGPMPKQGSILKLDGRVYRVKDAIHEDGVYSITIEANRA